MFIYQIALRCNAESLVHEIYVTVTYIYFEVKFWVILTHNPKE